MAYIDRDKLIENKFKNDISYNAFVNLVKRQPTAEVVEVKHGKWFIGKDIFGNGFINCSECLCDVDVDFDEPDEFELFKYCPHCGAKMDGKETEDAKQIV